MAGSSSSSASMVSAAMCSRCGIFSMQLLGLRKQIDAFQLMASVNPHLSATTVIQIFDALIGPETDFNLNTSVEPKVSKEASISTVTMDEIKEEDEEPDDHHLTSHNADDLHDPLDNDSFIEFKGTSATSPPYSLSSLQMEEREHHNDEQSFSTSTWMTPNRSNNRAKSAERSPDIKIIHVTSAGSRHDNDDFSMPEKRRQGQGRPSLPNRPRRLASTSANLSRRAKLYGAAATWADRRDDSDENDEDGGGGGGGGENGNDLINTTRAKLTTVDGMLCETYRADGTSYWQCLQCSRQLTAKGSARLHIRRVHLKERIVCKNCHRKFYDLCWLKMHGPVCPGAPNKGPMKRRKDRSDKGLKREAMSAVDEYLELLTDSSGKTICKCLQCGKPMTTRNNGRLHVRRVHFNERLSCPGCPRKFYDTPNLTYHKLNCPGFQMLEEEQNEVPTGAIEVKRETTEVQRSPMVTRKMTTGNGAGGAGQNGPVQDSKKLVVRNPFPTFNLADAMSAKVQLERMEFSEEDFLEIDSNEEEDGGHVLVDDK